MTDLTAVIHDLIAVLIDLGFPRSYLADSDEASVEVIGIEAFAGGP